MHETMMSMWWIKNSGSSAEQNLFGAREYNNVEQETGEMDKTELWNKTGPKIIILKYKLFLRRQDVQQVFQIYR
jgi:hypothetical protein